MEKFNQVMVVNIVIKLLDHVVGFTIGKSYLGLAQDWRGEVRNLVGEE